MMDAASWATHLKLLPWITVFFLPLEFFPLCFSCGFYLWNEKGRFAVSIHQRKWRFATV